MTQKTTIQVVGKTFLVTEGEITHIYPSSRVICGGAIKETDDDGDWSMKLSIAVDMGNEQYHLVVGTVVREIEDTFPNLLSTEFPRHAPNNAS